MKKSLKSHIPKLFHFLLQLVKVLTTFATLLFVSVLNAVLAMQPAIWLDKNNYTYLPIFKTILLCAFPIVIVLILALIPTITLNTKKNYSEELQRLLTNIGVLGNKISRVVIGVIVIIYLLFVCLPQVRSAFTKPTTIESQDCYIKETYTLGRYRTPLFTVSINGHLYESNYATYAKLTTQSGAIRNTDLSCAGKKLVVLDTINSVIDLE